MDSLSQLKIILKNSFAGIKADMDGLKRTQDEALANSYKIKQDVDSIKTDYTPKDKFNLLKIQVGELNNQLKKIWDLERDIKSLSEKKTSKTDFDREMEKFREEVSKKFSEQNSGFSKRLSEQNSSLNKRLVQVNDKAASSFDRINENMKLLITKNQVSALIADVNNEFNTLRNGVEEIKKIKDTITAKELERRTGIINARIDLLAKELVKANQKIAECVTGEQVKKLVEEVNNEFNDIKHAVSELSKLRAFTRTLDADSIKRHEFTKRVADLNTELNNSRKDVQELKDFLLKNYSKNDETKRAISSLELNLTKKINELATDIMSLKKTEVSDVKKLKEKIKEEKPKFVEIRERAEKTPGKPKSYKALSVVSILLIILAFASLAGAVIAYFALEPALTNYLTIGAVAAFVLGIILRVIVIRKRK